MGEVVKLSEFKRKKTECNDGLSICPACQSAFLRHGRKVVDGKWQEYCYCKNCEKVYTRTE